MVKEITEYVTGEEVGTIHVYEMAGFGKTAVVSEVNDLILNDYRSCGPEEKLQIDLNKATGSRADTLASAWKELRFLIILDDMWKKLSLELIWIPVPTRENGCKVIIVSRSLPVFNDIKIDKKFEIKPLSDTAARELFEREAGIRFSDLRDDTRTMAEKMVDECDGLPLAIGFLAQTLKELKIDADSVDAAWNAALLKLQSSHLVKA
ncbi:disease resistance protein SUMM2-like [Rosa chinensis]|uniref:disease resistance protein SUMM2-like n=1 Tax=Rosa chinensis TaxID=74649 RepID=UPI000D08B158|nr:disease resistance protein SUMM2-like [Rosa chinensis]